MQGKSVGRCSLVIKQQQREGAPTEHLSGSVDRVTFHSEESGFCVLRVKVKGHRELITVIGSAASITPGEYIDCLGIWHNDKTHERLFCLSRAAGQP